MKPDSKQYRDIVVRAFVATGKDGGPGLVEYIDKLERAVLQMDKRICRRPRAKSREHVDNIIQYHKAMAKGDNAPRT